MRVEPAPFWRHFEAPAKALHATYELEQPVTHVIAWGAPTVILRATSTSSDGMTNKEIAQHLFVTVGTVQTTLVHVYRKLDIGGHRDIAAAIGE